MKTQTQQTPYQIFKSSHGWGVGKDNSETEIFYFDTFEKAILKLIDLRGDDEILSAVNSYDSDKERIAKLEVLYKSARTQANEQEATIKALLEVVKQIQRAMSDERLIWNIKKPESELALLYGELSEAIAQGEKGGKL